MKLLPELGTVCETHLHLITSLPFRVCVTLLSLLLPLKADEEGRLRSIDTKAYTLTIDRTAREESFRYRPSTEVKLDGQRIPIDQLVPGMELKIKISEKGVAGSILATQPKSFDQKLYPGPMNVKVTGRSLTITSLIAGADAIKVQAKGIWWEHISAMRHGMPQQITLNGMPWTPDWKDRTSSKLTFQPELAGFALASFYVEKTSGRPAMRVHQPTAENDFTLGVELIDNPVGSGPIEVRITW